MSNFKRLSNLAKGKVKSIFNPSDEGGMADLDRELDQMRGDDSEGDSAPRQRQSRAPRSEKHAILDKLLNNGLLSQEEYEIKLAALDGTVPPPTPTKDDSKSRVPPKPKKRTL